MKLDEVTVYPILIQILTMACKKLFVVLSFRYLRIVERIGIANMDSSVRRSNLSKEKLAVLEALSNYKSGDKSPETTEETSVAETSSPEVYVRKNKDKELDLLWKDFRLPRGERSPMVYLGIGFISGIISTLLVSACIGLSSTDFGQNFKFGFKMPVSSSEVSVVADDDSAVAEDAEDTTTETVAEPTEQKKFGFFGSNKKSSSEEVSAPAVQDKEYTVQSGDTMESILKKFYGQYTPEKAEAVMKINNMTNPNKLAIDQKLIIPDVPATASEE